MGELKQNKYLVWNFAVSLTAMILVSFISPSTLTHTLAHAIGDHDQGAAEVHIDHPACNHCESDGHDCCFELQHVRITTQKTSSPKKIPFSQSLWLPDTCRNTFEGKDSLHLVTANFVSPLLPQNQFRGTVLII